MKHLVFVLIIALVGCANPLAVKKTLPPGIVGQAIQVGSTNLTIVRAARSQTTAGQPLPAGLPNLTVQINVRNDADTPVEIGPSAFSVEDDEKKTHAPREPAPQPAFAAKSLAKGESNAGLLSFEVPASATLTLLFKAPQSDYDVVRVNLIP